MTVHNSRLIQICYTHHNPPMKIEWEVTNRNSHLRLITNYIPFHNELGFYRACKLHSLSKILSDSEDSRDQWCDVTGTRLQLHPVPTKITFVELLLIKVRQLMQLKSAPIRSSFANKFVTLFVDYIFWFIVNPRGSSYRPESRGAFL